MSNEVPVKFTYQDKEHSGMLTKVAGAGTSGAWHLMVNNFYWGQLHLTENFGWQFTSNTITDSAELQRLSVYFGEYLTAWYE